MLLIIEVVAMVICMHAYFFIHSVYLHQIAHVFMFYATSLWKNIVDKIGTTLLLKRHIYLVY
jgi:hypothetical protein